MIPDPSPSSIDQPNPVDIESVSDERLDELFEDIEDEVSDTGDLLHRAFDADTRQMISSSWSKYREAVKAPTELNLEALGPQFREYRDDPVGFVKDVLGQRIWKGEKIMLNSLRDHLRTSVRSCRKSGKTFTAAAAVHWFLHTRNGIVVTLAPKRESLKTIIWPQIRELHLKSRRPLPGKPDILQYQLAPKRFAIGVSASDPEGLQGYHAGVVVPDDPDGEPPVKIQRGNGARPFTASEAPPELGEPDKPEEPLSEEAIDELKLKLEDADAEGTGSELLIIVDEAVGVDDRLLQALQGSIIGERTRFLLLGNPLQDPLADHEFARSHQPGSGYYRIKLFAEDAPDDLDADVSEKAPYWMLDQAWIDGRKRAWGENSPLYRAHVLAQFSDNAIERQVVTRRMLLAALEVQHEIPDDPVSWHMGIDVAAQGKDRSVAALWAGPTLVACHPWRTDDTMKTAAMIVELTKKWRAPGGDLLARNVHVDVAGLGKGVVDRLRQCGMYVDAVDYGRSPRYARRKVTGEMLFMNLKAELHWTMRCLLEAKELHIPKRFTELWIECGWPTYDFKMKGKGTEMFVAEDKATLREKYGRSPDMLDAALIGLARGGPGSGTVTTLSPWRNSVRRIPRSR